MKVALENLEPGTVVKTPDVFMALGWTNASAIYAGDSEGTGPAFLVGAGKELQRQGWPYGAYNRPAPQPAEFETVEDTPLLTAHRAFLQKNLRNAIGHNGSSGADPEFFVVDAKDAVIPARSFLGSKVESPSMFYDGLQAEITPHGEGCLQVFSNRIVELMAQVSSAAYLKNREARITLKNHFKFTPAQMAAFSDEDVAFRCSSSLNIYDDLGQAPDAREYPWRFAGGHIHVGLQGKRSAPVLKAMVRALDGIVGVAGVSLARNWDIPERRRMYGRAGEFRLPKHGLEYRVLSNFWLAHPLIFHLVFEMARFAYRMGEAGAFPVLYEAKEEEIRDCINHCDVELASKLIERNAGVYNNIFECCFGARTTATRKAMETLRNGLEVVVPNTNDIRGNWHKNASGYPLFWRAAYGNG